MILGLRYLPFVAFWKAWWSSVLMRHFFSPRKLSAWSECDFSSKIVRYCCHNLVTVDLEQGNLKCLIAQVCKCNCCHLCVPLSVEAFWRHRGDVTTAMSPCCLYEGLVPSMLVQCSFLQSTSKRSTIDDFGPLFLLIKLSVWS